MAIDPTKVMTDIFKVYIDTVEMPLAVAVEFPASFYKLLEIKSGPTGDEVVGLNVIGRDFRFKIMAQEPDAAALVDALNVTGNSPAAVGSQLAGHVVKVVPFGDGDSTRAIKFYNVAFDGNLGRVTGKTNYQYEIGCIAMRDAATGKVWEWAVA